MNKLLSAEFERLFKSFVFRLGMLFSTGLAVFVVTMRWMDVRKNAETYASLSIKYSNADGLIFVGGLYIIFVIAVFVGIFVGTEYSDGTIRNKITAGHTRGCIYLSKWIVCAVTTIMIHLLYICLVLLLGNLLIGGTTLSARQLLGFGAASTTAVVALVSFLLFFSMCIQSKAVGSVICLLSTIIMLFTSLTIAQKLEEPEFFDAYQYVDEETHEMVSVEQERNPYYLTGTKRKVYEFLNDFLSVSQLYQIAMNRSDRLGFIILYDCIIVIGANCLGMIVFQKKDVK
ncbi:MAG: ABC transporter permease subunit [Hespellia sp.]|jgi:ABC-2 type transport system permease protein|nr:ABC transporter permease subunit [Hespellia sp.]